MKKDPKSKKIKEARVRKGARHRSFKLSKRIKPTFGLLPTSWILFKKSLKHLWQYKRAYLGIAAIYGLLNLVLVRGIEGGSDIVLLSDLLKEAGGNRLLDSVGLFEALVIGPGSGTDVTSMYQFLILVICSLATIWTLRRTRKQERVGARQAFYNGMGPLIPFLLVIGALLVMCLPLAAANAVYGIVFINGIAVLAIEKILWTLLLILIVLLSMHLLTSSAFALYIVTMPDVSPMMAIRSSRNIARFRRFTILRKLLFLPFILFIVGAVILLPIIMYAPVAAEPVYFILSALALVVVHAYMYGLYRELL